MQQKSVSRWVLLAFVLLIISACEETNKEAVRGPEGKLFIIGGGKRPANMVQEMIRLSGTDTSGYIIVLPMASGEPDTSGWYGKKQFTEQGVRDVVVMNIPDPGLCPEDCIDSIRHASMIYITGGDQSRFMDIVLNTRIHEAIKTAYNEGAVIAGTSAGAAVMSRKMITGNEFKHPEYTGDFQTIEAENMEIREGLGLLEKAIVDQHFVWRMRMNRLISVALENPGDHCFGIDESTALLVDGNILSVFGESQVVRILYRGTARTNDKGLIGGRGLELDILLPGDTLDISHPR
ncbi:MAG: cyanophycinase [Bacteroidales bacterium]|jgi:cyanophycinase|nr:cyanophycinase [Bacteroidales bacterium]